MLVGASLSTHLLTSAKCLVWYFREFLLPVRLCQEHSISLLPLAWSWDLLAVLAVLSAAAAFAAWLWRKDRVAFAGFAIAVLWIAPFLNLIPYLNLSLVANRYIYLSIAGMLLCVGRLTRPAWELRLGRLAFVPLACAAVGLAYAALSMSNLSHYSDPLEVWERAACCAPSNPRAHEVAGSYYAGRQRFDEAEREIRAAGRLQNGDYNFFAAMELAGLYIGEGRAKKAELIYQSLARSFPPESDGLFSGLGTCELRLGRFDAAISSLTRAVKLNPRDGYSRLNLAYCYSQRKGKRWLRLAEIEWKAATADPGMASMAFADLGLLYQKQKRLAEAQKAYERSLEFNPNRLDITTSLATLYAESGRTKEGLKLFDKLAESLKNGQQIAFSAANALTLAELKVSSNSLPDVVRERALFVSKHPRLMASQHVADR
jgi:tetratricopeptide (TPR) repeat protein